jgi:hypothetical protein
VSSVWKDECFGTPVLNVFALQVLVLSRRQDIEHFVFVLHIVFLDLCTVPLVSINRVVLA